MNNWVYFSRPKHGAS